MKRHMLCDGLHRYSSDEHGSGEIGHGHRQLPELNVEQMVELKAAVI
jgi:hypothetical protein